MFRVGTVHMPSTKIRSIHMITILHDAQVCKLIHIVLYKVYALMMDDRSLHAKCAFVVIVPL